MPRRIQLAPSRSKPTEARSDHPKGRGDRAAFVVRLHPGGSRADRLARERAADCRRAEFRYRRLFDPGGADRDAPATLHADAGELDSALLRMGGKPVRRLLQPYADLFSRWRRDARVAPDGSKG